MLDNKAIADNILADDSPTSGRLETFYAEASSLIREDSDAGFRECLPLLEQLCREGAFTELLNSRLDAVLRGSYESRNRSADHLMVTKTPEFTLLLRALVDPQRQDKVFAQPFDQIIAPLNRNGVRYTSYHQPRPMPNDVFDKSRSIASMGSNELSQWQGAYFRAGEDTYLIQPPSQDEEPPLLAILVSSDKLSLRWEYDVASLAPSRLISVDNASSRLEFVIWMLTALDDDSCLPSLEGLVAHPAHFVRWAALQAICHFDAERGMRSLAEATNDPHEHIRRAASTALSQVKQQSLIKSEGSSSSHDGDNAARA